MNVASQGACETHSLEERVRAHLGQEHRFAHTLRVAKLAEELARLHGVDAERARIAGLLHDLARLYSNERLIAECEARNMPIDAFERAHPVVLHARLGAELAREEFDITDEAVLSAITKHTLGADVMSPLDCVVFLADGLEPERDFPGQAAILDLAKRDLWEGMRATLSATMVYLQRQGKTIAPQTAAAARSFGVNPQEFSGQEL